MTPIRLLNTAIIPALAELALCGIADTPDARRFMLAIAIQETGLRNRRQVIAGRGEVGPAASFWQGEITGGMCTGVLKHFQVRQCMRRICDHFNVEPTPERLWEAIRYHDILAAVAARLLIYTLPGKLPTTADDGWEQYIEAWRPGKPHRKTWAAAWAIATDAVKEIA